MLIGPTPIPEPLDVQDENRSMHADCGYITQWPMPTTAASFAKPGPSTNIAKPGRLHDHLVVDGELG